MENCIEYQERISALLDGALPEQERQTLLAHLAECPACQAYWDDQLAIQAALNTLEAEAPAGFADAVMARVGRTAQIKPTNEKPTKKVISLPRWQRWAAAAACCALVLLGTLGARTGLGGGETYDLAPADADGTAVYAAPAPESRAAEVPAVFAALPAEDGPCTLTTSSSLAHQWVRDTLGAEAESAEAISLTQAQLLELRGLLDSAGEPYTWAAADSGWCLVLAP